MLVDLVVKCAVQAVGPAVASGERRVPRGLRSGWGVGGGKLVAPPVGCSEPGRDLRDGLVEHLDVIAGGVRSGASGRSRVDA